MWFYDYMGIERSILLTFSTIYSLISRVTAVCAGSIDMMTLFSKTVPTSLCTVLSEWTFVTFYKNVYSSQNIPYSIHFLQMRMEPLTICSHFTVLWYYSNIFTCFECRLQIHSRAFVSLNCVNNYLLTMFRHFIMLQYYSNFLTLFARSFFSSQFNPKQFEHKETITYIKRMWSITYLSYSSGLGSQDHNHSNTFHSRDGIVPSSRSSHTTLHNLYQICDYHTLQI